MRARLALLAFLLVPAAALAQYNPQYPPPSQYPPAPPQPPPPPFPARRALPEQGVTLGARVGFGFPTGDLAGAGTGAVSDLVDGKVPIWLELGYRFNRHVRAHVYLELAPASVRNDVCFAGGGCYGNDIRLGADIQLHASPYGAIDPWIGIGGGGEWLNAHGVAVTTASGLIPADQQWSGWEFPLLEGGLDIPVAPHFTVGPYAAVSFGQFTTYHESGFNYSFSQNISSRASHQWIQFGVKFTANL